MASLPAQAQVSIFPTTDQVSALSANAPAGNYAIYTYQAGYWVLADQYSAGTDGYLFVTTNAQLVPGDATFTYSTSAGTLWNGWLTGPPLTYWQAYGAPSSLAVGTLSSGSLSLVISTIPSLALPTGTPDGNGWYQPATIPTGFSQSGWTANSPLTALTDWNVVFTPPSGAADTTVRLIYSLSDSTSNVSPLLNVDNTAADPFSALPTWSLPVPTGTASTAASTITMTLLTPIY